ncbi:NAD-dependent protein deacetylase SRT1-like [Selaginella moellendorffii]|uniref:NAD-dependent protein deacetylase SRT1-like n=1 Tax=Selaginella moellendorffii TaxID=88036 RepID=UPI000D1C2C54|nr:NAD-dependent protein deacetylase SRT1-like [Selaginella moellendorffii]|eukprot:XP_024541959.1 NAD-dependent protein deacetylase SRT1-like [Selaginella moellendorffii]
MALGYAEKLSFKADVGKLGMPELFDPAQDVDRKIAQLAQLIQESKHLVAFTGAGISTSCGIPDFRGPKGIWTLQHEGKPLPKADVQFHQARPGTTHMALVELVRAGILKFIISQNIDGLHLRSGIPRDKLSELHGNSFMETCPSCGREYLRDFEMETIGIKRTGRRCSVPGCVGRLVDTIVDWEGALPPKELRAAEKHCKEADLIVCLGTSLQITPACNLPLKTVRAGGKLVIVNLQATPKDKKATLVIHARVDQVILGVMRLLNRNIPPFIRLDHLLVCCSYSWLNNCVKWTLRIESPHGNKAPLQFIKHVEIEFPDRPDFKPALLKERPYVVRRKAVELKALDVLLKLHMSDGCMCEEVEILHPLSFEGETEKQKQLPQGPVDLSALQREKVQCGRVVLLDVRKSSEYGTAVEYALVTCVTGGVEQQGKAEPGFLEEEVTRPPCSNGKQEITCTTSLEASGEEAASLLDREMTRTPPQNQDKQHHNRVEELTETKPRVRKRARLRS